MSNKLADPVRAVASHESVAEFTPEVLETIRSKYQSSPNYLRSVSVPSYCLHVPATSSHVVNAMKSFADSSSGGIDGLRPGHIRDLKSAGTAETEMRLLDSISTIISVFLSGQLSDYPCNYFLPPIRRIVSILLSFSKCFEKTVANRLFSIKKYNFLDKCQFGFIPGRNTIQAVLFFN